MLVTPDLCFSGSCGKCEMVLSYPPDDGEEEEMAVVRACETAVPEDRPEVFVEVLPLIADEDGWARLEAAAAASRARRPSDEEEEDLDFV